jgi:hypothetical protein
MKLWLILYTLSPVPAAILGTAAIPALWWFWWGAFTPLAAALAVAAWWFLIRGRAA